MIDKEEATNILHDHDHWARSMRPEWRKTLAMYEDRWWDLMDGTRSLDDADKARVKVEVNILRANVKSIMASLFYKGAKTIISADSVVRKLDLELAEQEALREIADRFLDTHDLEEDMLQAVLVGAMYGGSGVKIGMDAKSDDLDDELPVDVIWTQFLAPWELVLDRMSDPRNQRYIGHTYFEHVDDLRALYPEKEAAFRDPVVRPDFVTEGSSAPSERKAGKSYLRVLELYDIAGTYKGEDEEERGRQTIWLVRGGAEGEEHDMVLLYEGPMPFRYATGRPAVNIIPIIMDNSPEYRLKSVPAMRSIYSLAKENNHVATYLANAFRMDVGRLLLYLKGSLDEEALSAWQSGQDMVSAGVEGNNLDRVATFLTAPPVSTTVLQYAKFLEEGRQDVQTTADFTRGTPGQYLTATEVTRLNDYSETTLGEMRKRTDRAMEAIIAIYFIVLEAAMEEFGADGLDVWISQEESVKVTRELLQKRWKPTLVDTANTPIARQQKRAEFGVALPMLLELMTIVGNPEIPEVQRAIAKSLAENLVALYDLPEDVRVRVRDASTEPEPEPEPLSQGPAPAAGPIPGPGAGPLPPDMPLTPEEEAALMDPAVRQAIANELPEGVI